MAEKARQNLHRHIGHNLPEASEDEQLSFLKVRHQDEWDAALGGERATRERIMGRLNELLNRRSYIRNLVANVAKELAEV